MKKRKKKNQARASLRNMPRPENAFVAEDLSSLQVLRDDADFDARLDLVPENPGVYLMKDHQDKILYVGKAVNLRNRLRSYFGPNPKGAAKVQELILRIRDFSWLVCQNELEALVLESNLIKRYQPFYNILLKDDRDYPYMRITMNELYPRIEKAYRIGADQKEGCRYYGPYLNGDLNAALRSIHEIFPLKTCRRVFPRDIGKERPCIRYHIGKCVAPCTGEVSPEDYRAICASVCRFLEGRYQGLMEDLEQQMKAQAEKMDFEGAAKTRDRLQALARLSERQIAVLSQNYDCDVLSLAQNEVEACVLKLEVRGGKISGTATHFIEAIDDPQEALRAFILQYYQEANQIPNLLLIDARAADARTADARAADARTADACTASDIASARDQAEPTSQGPEAPPSHEPETARAFPKEEMEAYLTYLRNEQNRSTARTQKVRIELPQRGEKKALCDMAQRNATQNLKRRSHLAGGALAIDPQEGPRLLQESLQLPVTLKRIEAYDVANLGQDAIVCGMVVFEQGKVARNQARHFQIQQQEGQDDYRAMAEALSRRLRHLREGDTNFGARPDLILLDGGRQHVLTIQAVLKEEGFSDIPIAGMVKDDRHRTRGLVKPTGEIEELAQRIGLLTQSSQSELLAPTELAFKSTEQKQERDRALILLRFLTAVQNEVHRQANRYHQLLRKKKMLRYKLEDIPGVGPARRKDLMRAFGTIKAVAEASLEELMEHCPNIGEKTARQIFLYFHPERDEDSFEQAEGSFERAEADKAEVEKTEAEKAELEKAEAEKTKPRSRR